MRPLSIKIVFLLVMLLPAGAGAVVEQLREVDWTGWTERGRELLGDMTRAWERGDLPELAFSPEEINQLLVDLQQALEGDNVLSLAGFAEVLPQVVEALRQTETGRAYADWLEPRIDFSIVALWSWEEGAERGLPSEPPPAPGQPVTRPAPTTEQFQNRYVTDLGIWRERIRQRRKPAAADRYVPALQAVFQRHGVPPELVWLAEVESSFNPEALSPVGAVGLFQFMAPTAEWMGLSLSPEDQRKNPMASAEAAARYLRYLYGRFEDWPLVLAAYNAGEGRVRRLLREQQATTFNAIVPRLPNETRMYVPKVLATIEVREGKPALPMPSPRP